MHGWSVSERIQQISRDVLQVNQGSLYPAMHRLEHQGWIRAEWGVSELGRRARFYTLTSEGRKQLDAETENLGSPVRSDRARVEAGLRSGGGAPTKTTSR